MQCEIITLIAGSQTAIQARTITGHLVQLIVVKVGLLSFYGFPIHQGEEGEEGANSEQPHFRPLSR